MQGWGNLYCDITSNKSLYGAAWDGADGHSAAGCLSSKAVYDSSLNTWTANNHEIGDMLYISPAALDLSGHFFSAWIEVPADMAATASYTALAFIMNQSGGYSYGGGFPTLDTQGWMQLSCAINDMNGNCDVTQVNRIGIHIARIGSTAADPSKDVPDTVVKFDDISF